MKDKTAFQKHFRLAQLRAKLAKAIEEKNTSLIEQLSQQIDALQLEEWKKEKKDEGAIL